MMKHSSIVHGATLLGAVLCAAAGCEEDQVLTTTRNLDRPGPMAMVCAAGYITTLKHLTSRYSPFFLTAVQAAVGAVFFFPVLFLPQVILPRTVEPVVLPHCTVAPSAKKPTAHNNTAFLNIMEIASQWVLG